MMAMEMTPEMIDAATIQLKMIFEHAENIPPEVRDSGKDFVDKLEAWSERLKKAAEVKAAG
jgi:hypothetical protein